MTGFLFSFTQASCLSIVAAYKQLFIEVSLSLEVSTFNENDLTTFMANILFL